MWIDQQGLTTRILCAKSQVRSFEIISGQCVTVSRLRCGDILLVREKSLLPPRRGKDTAMKFILSALLIGSLVSVCACAPSEPGPITPIVRPGQKSFDAYFEALLEGDEVTFGDAFDDLSAVIKPTRAWDLWQEMLFCSLGQNTSRMDPPKGFDGSLWRFDSARDCRAVVGPILAMFYAQTRRMPPRAGQVAAMRAEAELGSHRFFGGDDTLRVRTAWLAVRGSRRGAM